jgi:hypothetical protein
VGSRTYPEWELDGSHPALDATVQHDPGDATERGSVAGSTAQLVLDQLAAHNPYQNALLSPRACRSLTP